MPTPLTLSYHLPSLGTVAPPLHRESADLYRFLEKGGEIQRLKALDHLGTIRMAWEGAHHSRWEYVMSILFLVERCARADTPEIHLKTRVDLGGTRVSSGEELLKCWALLSNIGHLAGTFALERTLLFALKDRADTSLVGALEPELQSWANGVVNEVRVHRFFQVLGFLRLQELAAAANARAVDRRRWIAMMRALVVDSPSTEKLDELREIYRNIRRLAYLALDSHYTPAISHVDLARLASDASTLVPLVLKAHSADDDLRGLERFLTHQIYIGRPVLGVIARHEWPLRRFFHTMLEKDGVSRTVDLVAKPRGPELLGRLEQPFEPVARLEVFATGPFGALVPRRTDVYAEQMRADSWARTHGRNVRTIVWITAPGDEWVLQTHAPPGATRDRAAAWRHAFNEAVAMRQQLGERWSLGSSDAIGILGVLDRALFRSFARELIVRALDVVFETDVRWEFLSAQHVPPPLMGTRRELGNALKEWPSTGDARDDERLGARHVLKRRSHSYAVLTTPLEAFQRVGRAKFAEFDVVFAQQEGRAGLAVTLVEVKREGGGTCQSSAVRALNNKLRKFALQDGVVRDETRSDRQSSLGWAWTTLRAR